MQGHFSCGIVSRVAELHRLGGLLLAARKNLCRAAAEMEIKHEKKIALPVHGIDPCYVCASHSVLDEQ